MQLLFRILPASKTIAETREGKIAGTGLQILDLKTFYAAVVLYSETS